MLEKVQAALDQIRPMLKRDGGDAELIEVTPDGVVKLKLVGACGHCPMSQMTLKMGIEKRLKEQIRGKRSYLCVAGFFVRVKEAQMIKVKTFGMELKPLQTMHELAELDEMVNAFIATNKIKDVISVSDSPTTDDKGETIGLIRVLCYEV